MTQESFTDASATCWTKKKRELTPAEQEEVENLKEFIRKHALINKAYEEAKARLATLEPTDVVPKWETAGETIRIPEASFLKYEAM